MKLKLGDILVAIPMAICILTCITNVNGVPFSEVAQETPSTNTNQTFVGKYLETDYMFEQPSSTQYLISRTNGGTVQTHYGTFTNTTMELTSDHLFVGKYEGYSMSAKHQNEVRYYDENKRCILVESSLTVQLEEKSRTSLQKGELGHYTGYVSSTDMIKANIGDKWNYSYEVRLYEDGVYNETTTTKVEVTVKYFPSKIVQAGAFSTVHIEAIFWDNDVLTTKIVRWLGIVNGKKIAEENYERNNGQWVLSTKMELLSETDTQIVNSYPDNGQMPLYLLITIGLVASSVVIVFSVFGFKTLAKRKALHQQQENERRQTYHREEEQRRREQERREQQERERKDRERREQEYTRARKYAQINSTDPFEVLGVPRNASRQQVRDAFWMLSKEWHPDRFARHSDSKVMQLANENYVRIKEAYETICRTKGWT